MDLSNALELAHELADLADVITLDRFKARDLVVTTKPDLTPVTDADRAVESALRAHLAEVAPDHGIIGEEYGSDPAPWSWIIDPIDGTKNYVRGIPVYASLIALAHEGHARAGVVSAPALARRWWAAEGSGAYLNGERISVSGVQELSDAQISYNSFRNFEEEGHGDVCLELTRRAWRTRGFGDFWSHVLVAEGAVDLGIEPIVSVWDLAALQVIVEEAGGRFTDFSGVSSYDGGNVISSNGLIHDEVLDIINRRSGEG